MAEYVDQHMPDDICQRLVRLTPVVQNRSAVNEYMVNVPGRIAGAFFSASETPLLKTEKFIRRFEAQFALDLL